MRSRALDGCSRVWTIALQPLCTAGCHSNLALHPGIHWDTWIFPLYPSVGTYNNNVYAVPLGGSTLQLLYRRDVLERAGLGRPPDTWQQLLCLASSLHGQSMAPPAAAGPSTTGGQNQGAEGDWSGHGFCLDVRPGECGTLGFRRSIVLVCMS